MVEVERLHRRRQDLVEKFTEERPQLLGPGHGPEHDLFACAVDEVARERGAQVGCDQRLLELGIERFVDGAIGLEYGLELGTEELSRTPQACAEALTERRQELHCWGGRTSREITAPLGPRAGNTRPFSSKLTPPALPMVRTKGPFDTHSRT